MSKIPHVKLLFRNINDGLTKIEELPLSERTRTLESLRRINEEMCDYVIDLVKFVEKNKHERASI